MIFANTFSVGAVSYRNAHFGWTNVTIWLDYLRCDGTESSVLDCAHNGIGVYSYYHCNRHDHDAGVECGIASKQTQNIINVVNITISYEILHPPQPQLNHCVSTKVLLLLGTG